MALSSCTPAPIPDEQLNSENTKNRADSSSLSHLNDESEWRAAYADFPRFVDGSARCGLTPGATPPPREPRLKQVAPLGQSESSRNSLHASEPRNSTVCSGPKAWCLLFGPSKLDEQNERLRLRMKKMNEEKARQAENLRERLHQVEATAEAERRRHAEELRRLSETLAGRGVYLTNDESMSLASPQRLIWAIDHNAPLPASQVRPHELLNYFAFDTQPVEVGQAFSILPEIAQHPARPDEVTLGFSVRGRSSSRATRDHANLAYVVDRSASMSEPGHLDFAKRGLLRSLEELKEGDIVHLVLFDATTCELARNFVVGRDSMQRLQELIESIEPGQGSNLPDGLARGYSAVNRIYQANYSNRVVLLTDTQASPEEDIREAMNLSSRNFDARRIRLSALGLGANVDDKLLDELTERGRGASIFLSSENETDAVFGERFVALIENAASDVHFRLQLPESLTLRAFYGEEASSSRGRVQSVHYASGTTQMYLANLVNPSGTIAAAERIELRIEYEDPKSARAESADFSWSAADLGISPGGKVPARAGFNLTKARMVATFGYHLRAMAERYAHVSSVWEKEAQVWQVPGDRDQRPLVAAARQSCLTTQGRLDAFAAELQGESEARRIASLWTRYCERFPAPEERLMAPRSQALAQSSASTALGALPLPAQQLGSSPIHISILPINDFPPGDGDGDFDSPGIRN